MFDDDPTSLSACFISLKALEEGCLTSSPEFKSTSSNTTFVVAEIRNIENRAECDDLCDRSVAFCSFLAEITEIQFQ